MPAQSDGKGMHGARMPGQACLVPAAGGLLLLDAWSTAGACGKALHLELRRQQGS